MPTGQPAPVVTTGDGSPGAYPPAFAPSGQVYTGVDVNETGLGAVDFEGGGPVGDELLTAPGNLPIERIIIVNLSRGILAVGLGASPSLVEQQTNFIIPPGAKLDERLSAPQRKIFVQSWGSLTGLAATTTQAVFAYWLLAGPSAGGEHGVEAVSNGFDLGTVANAVNFVGPGFGGPVSIDASATNTTTVDASADAVVSRVVIGSDVGGCIQICGGPSLWVPANGSIDLDFTDLVEGFGGGYHPVVIDSDGDFTLSNLSANTMNVAGFYVYRPSF